MSDEAKTYWDLLAAQFQHQQPPLRPSPEDVRIFERAIGEWNSAQASDEINALLFGVTPEIANLAWPANTRLIAIEKSQPMIDLIWPGDVPGRRRVVRGNWFEWDLKEHSQHIIIGDGVLTALSYPNQYAEAARLIARWLKPGGRLVLRVFMSSSKRETFEEILSDLKANRISRFDILKWRLAMMLQKDIREGVVLDEVFRTWAKLEREHPQLLAQTGWPRATMDTIKLYAGRTARYTFPTLDELNEVFSAELQRIEVVVPGYDFGSCCPTLIYSPRN